MSYTQQKEIETISLLSFCDLLIDTREIKRRKLDRQTDFASPADKTPRVSLSLSKTFLQERAGEISLWARETANIRCAGLRGHYFFSAGRLWVS